MPRSSSSPRSRSGVGARGRYVRRAVVDADQFANRATAALQDDSVRSLIAERDHRRLVLARQERPARRPAADQAVVAGVVGGRAFTAVFRAAVRDVHRACSTATRRRSTLALADIGTVVAARSRPCSPTLARRVRPTGGVELVRATSAAAGGDCARTADAVRLLALAAAARRCPALAPARSSLSRPTAAAAVVELGVGLAGAGVADRRRAGASRARSCSAASRRPERRRRRRRSGTRSSATCAPPAGSSPAAAPSSPPRRRPSSGRSTSARRCAARRARSRRAAPARAAVVRGVALRRRRAARRCSTATPSCAARPPWSASTSIYAGVERDAAARHGRATPARERPRPGPRAPAAVIAAVVAAC